MRCWPLFFFNAECSLLGFFVFNVFIDLKISGYQRELAVRLLEPLAR
jgi:hypothetical protein